MSSPPPEYSSEPLSGETTLVDSDMQQPRKASQENQQFAVPQNVLPPPQRPPYPYQPTPLSTPYTTAPNTPMAPFGAYAQQQHFGYGIPMPAPLPNPPAPVPIYSIQMQQMYSSPQQQMMPPPQQPNAPINVVVNANSNANSNGMGGSGSPTICPKCRKGVIVRMQKRWRKWLIIFISLLTCWFLFCLPLILLRWNYVDTCAYCRTVYGHRGIKKTKKK